MKLLISNIKTLVQVEETPTKMGCRNRYGKFELY